ncbi:ABC transporter permease [Putridiphycobacter roseus]|nr:FtsX-like permease family protein [Putridiphycobacter roseus]
MSIIIGVAVMIITVSIVTGFQNKIREKVIGFGSHIQISNMENNTSMESSPILYDSLFAQQIIENKNVKHIQKYVFKPAIIQSEANAKLFKLNGYTDTIVNQDVLGVLFKGVDVDYDLNFFKDKLVAGTLLDFDGTTEVLISEKIAKLLNYKVMDEMNAYFILNNAPKKRTFKIKGIYKTGLEEFDKKIIFTAIQSLQQLNNWGIQSNLTVIDSCINGNYIIKGLSFGSYPYHTYKWNGVYSASNLFLISGKQNRDIIFEAALDENSNQKEQVLIFDKSTLKVHIDSACDCTTSLLQQKPITYLSDTLIKMPFGTISIMNGKGTSNNYIGGYEVLINEWRDLEKMDEIIYNEIPFELKTTKITEIYQEIFAWLGFLDMNIVVILIMMLAVSLINMVTSLLVLILEKTNFIGILKAIGATNWSIRKIFIYNSLLLLIKGLFWGNILGIGLLLVQQYFNVLPLDPAIYYLDAVPVEINASNILSINLLTIVTCFIVLIIPSYLITKIKPIQAIKFN